MLANKLDMIKVETINIKNETELILQDIEDFEGSDELFMMESTLNRIIRFAESAKYTVMAAYDELEEE